MKNLLIVVIACCLATTITIGQGTYQLMDTDSLFAALKSEKNDTSRINIYLTLHNKFRLSDFLVAKSYADTAYNLSHEIEWKKGIAQSAMQLGIAHSLTGQADKAIELLNESINYATEIQDMQSVGRCYMTLGNIQYDKSNYAEALPHYLNSFETFESIKYYAGMSAALIWVGIIYQFGQKDYDKAIETYKEADEYAILGSSDLNRSYILSNLATIYYETDQYDSSIAYNFKSIAIKTRFNDTRGLSNTYSNLANCYFELKQYPEALEYYGKAFDIRKENSDSTGIANSLVNLGKVEFELDNFNKSIQYYQEGLAIATRIDHKEAIQQAYQLLSQAYEKQGNYKLSLDAYKAFKTISDTIFNIESEEILSELRTKFDTEKKEDQILIQQAQLAQQQSANQRNIAGIIALSIAAISLVIVILLIRSRARKKQKLLLQEGELKIKEAQMNATISSQEKERSRVAKDLHDGFGQMISVLNLNLKALSKDGGNQHEIFENSAGVLDEMYAELKSICFNLMPQTLIKLGIGPALTEFADRINKSGTVHVTVDLFQMDDRLPELVEISLYRISQEWINNILKYSDARQVTLQLTREENELTLLIEDDGIGFDRSVLINGKGNGWSNINSRVNLIKGEIDLDTVPGRKGTTFIAELTLQEQLEQTTSS